MSNGWFVPADAASITVMARLPVSSRRVERERERDVACIKSDTSEGKDLSMEVCVFFWKKKNLLLQPDVCQIIELN